jgi:MFS family permease
MIVSHSFKTVLTILTINILSWYEFVIYIALSPIIATIFFPSFELQKSLFYTLLIASFTFIARIGGGLFFGKIADNDSKRKSLMYSVILMSIATVCIAILPTYKSIGYTSLLLLIAIRLVQAFCIGGEFGSSIAFLMQIAPQKRVGLYGSIPMVGMGIGILLASLTSMFLSYFPIENVHNWGWRVPFLITGSLGVVSLYLRKDGKKNLTNQTKVAFSVKQYTKEIISRIGVFSCSMFHLYLFCILVKAVMFSHSIQLPSVLYTTNIITFVVFTLVGGVLSQHKYSKWVFVINIILLPFYTFLIFILQQYNFLMLASISVGMLQGMIPKILYNTLPKQYLTTNLSLVNNLTAVIFGSALVVVLQHFSMYGLVIVSLGLMVFSIYTFLIKPSIK